MQTLAQDPDIKRLQDQLSQFNILDVLGVADYEIRHSNVLAWLFDPLSSHGLGDKFLKDWLSVILTEAKLSAALVGLNAADVNQWQNFTVEVLRERHNIDVLVRIRFSRGKEWMICIENKLHSKQGSDQLIRYRQVVEKEYQGARKVFVYLTLSGEAPNDKNYLAARHEQVAQALRRVMEAGAKSISHHQAVFLEHYLNSIELKIHARSLVQPNALLTRHPAEFQVLLDQQEHLSEIAGAQAGAPKSKGDSGSRPPVAAIRHVLAARPGRQRHVTELIASLISSSDDPMKFRLASPKARIARFLPKAWDKPSNHQKEEGKPKLFWAVHLAEADPHLRMVASGKKNIELKRQMVSLVTQLGLEENLMRSQPPPDGDIFPVLIFDLPRLEETVDDAHAADVLWSHSLEILHREDVSSLIQKADLLLKRL